MFENVNEVAVLVSAILAMAMGSIWYSPLLFGIHWMRATGLTPEDLESSKTKMPKLIILAFVGNLVTLYVLAQFVAFSKAASIPLANIAFLLTVLLGAVMAGAVIWEQKRYSYFLINVGYAAVVVFGGMAIIWHWPW